MVVQGLRVNDVDLVQHGFDHHHVVVEITVDHGSFSITNVVAPLLLLDNTKPTRSQRIVMRGTLNNINLALKESIYHPRSNWNSHQFIDTSPIGLETGTSRRIGGDVVHVVVNGTSSSIIESSSNRDILSSSDPFTSIVSQISYVKEDLLFFVAPVNDRPVVILPVQITHLHTWRTYQDDLSRVIVSVDEVDTLEDTPISFEGISVRDVDASESDNGYGSVVVTVQVHHGTVSLAGISGSYNMLSTGASPVIDTSRTKVAHIDELLIGTGEDDSYIQFRTSVADAIVALSHITYLPALNYHGFDTLIVSVNDTGNHGVGGWMSDTQSIPLQILASNDGKYSKRRSEQM